MTGILLLFLDKLKAEIATLDESKLVRALLVFDFILCMLWIVVSNTKEGADQAQVLYAARDFVNGDFSKLEKDKYMGMYPYQLPLSFLYEPFYFLFGDVTPFLWQFINVFLICGIQYLIYRISQKSIKSEQYMNYIVLFQFFDLPIILYVAFVYGTIIGLFFSLCSIEALYVFWSTGKKFHLVWVCLSMTAACLLRTNCLIFAIALFIIVILYALETKNKKILFIIPLILLLIFSTKRIIINQYEARSGVEIGNGVPMTMNIAMGLSENEEKAAGWFNGFTWYTYLELECDEGAAKEFAANSISTSLNTFFSNPLGALVFFTEKINSMWLNSDFQGLWNNEHHGHYIGQAPIIYNLFHGELYVLSGIVLNWVTFWVYFGTLCFFVTHIRTIKWRETIFALMFIGGFVFQIFWEAKAQYVIVYYVLLFPYAAIGLQDISDRIKLKLLHRGV